MDTSKPYEIHPAAEGGFVVMTPYSVADGPYRIPSFVASFTSASDLIRWLAEQHGVKAAVAYEFPGLDAVRDPDDATERLVPRGPFPDDDGWTKWDGCMPPGFVKGEKCIARLRNGVCTNIHTGENDGCDWFWNDSTVTTMKLRLHDVIAYRPV